MERFARLFALTEATRVLDIGGTPGNWELLAVRPRVVLLNMPRAAAEVGGGVWVAGDGCALPFGNASFDVVFSNSVIEHVGAPERQEAFAQEVVRVGRGYWVQTPNRWFPVEAHLFTPLLHWLPKSWQRPVARFSVWRWTSGARGERREFYLRHYLDEVRLLDAEGMRQLFAGAQIWRERFLGWTKSVVAWRVPEPRDSG